MPTYASNNSVVNPTISWQTTSITWQNLFFAQFLRRFITFKSGYKPKVKTVRPTLYLCSNISRAW